MIAKAAHVSKSACLRTFQRQLGTTPYQYLQEFRLSKATRLLRETDLSIAAVAYKVGISQVSHFDALFKQKTGYLPKTFREL